MAARTITVQSRAGTTTVTTELTLAQAAALLAPDTREFQQSLVQSFRKYGDNISEGRARWILVLAQEILDRANRPVVNVGDLTGIHALFRTAYSQGMKRPKIRLQLANGTPVILFPAPKGNIHHGSINVVKGPYGSGMWGRIKDNGNTNISNPEVLALLQALIADPAGVAQAYGKLTGNCCFCDLTLSDERSLAVGYGPVCSKHYGLPWGDKPEQTIIERVAAELPPAPAPLYIGAFI